MKRLALLLAAALPVAAAFAQDEAGSTTEKLPPAPAASGAPASPAPEHPHEAHQTPDMAGSGSAASEGPAAAPTKPGPDGKLSVDAGEVTFDMPAAWKSVPPANMMRKAQVSVPKAAGDPEDGELAVSFFPGGGGGVEANVNRWYGQFETADGKPVNDAAKREKIKGTAGEVTFVDISGTMKASTMPGMGATSDRKGWRMLGGIVDSAAGPWFFKLTGPDKTLGAAVDAFKALLASVKTK